MILQLASRHCRKIAGFYLFVFNLSIVLPLGVRSAPINRASYYGGSGFMPKNNSASAAPHTAVKKVAAESNGGKTKQEGNKNFIGGPSQPEMSSFKSVSADKLVNLFTGDFSYNIPLLDVGGYPINIYYDGGISPEQEASWVGLGWNINPGNINRNMRGIPDDFNGEEKLTVEQRMKPNRTWGATIGGDVELLGLKLPVELELGAEFNNYLGPALHAGVRGSTSLFSVTKYSGNEKFAASLGVKADWGIDVNSRTGTSFSGKVSLSAQGSYTSSSLSAGLGVSTGYNSRSGLKALNISEQVHFNNTTERKNKALQVFLTKGFGTNYGTSITFAKPSYLPGIRMPVTNTSWFARLQVGLGSFGVAADIETEVFGQKSEIAPSDYKHEKPMVGYLYYQQAENHPEYVMDFTRFNDREVTPNTPVISVPQYTYDVFAIQGEGTGGNIRAYRYDFGYVRDNVTTSKDKNVSGGGDTDPPGHFGANLQIANTPSTTGEWKNGNKLRGVTGFSKKEKTAFGQVYFRNPGEATVSALGRYDNLGGTKMVRYELGGTGQSPTIEPVLKLFEGDSRPVRGAGAPGAPVSVKLTDPNGSYTPGGSRSQVISFLNAEEASVVGLDRSIRSYNNVKFLDDVKNTMLYDSFPRFDGEHRKKHHISQINVTEADGKRYVYGIPVYNIRQKDLTFSVERSYAEIPDQVQIEDNWATTGSGLLGKEATIDGYVQITTTPAYAHSFLLSGILSPDYVDITNNGITEDDLGTAVKFNYTKISDGNEGLYKWRTPHTTNHTGAFNAGDRSEKKDDKAMISYGERESWYLQSVESKDMIALFHVINRADGKGAVNEYGGVNNSNMLKALDKISLYNKADLVKNGLLKAKPIKTVHFVYTNELCKNTPDNNSGAADNGKLTLKSLYFTYNGKENRVVKNRYGFSYGNNSDYTFASTDRWGTYKPATQNPAGLKNSDYPYTIQPSADKTTINNNASAWSLKTIKLPSGGQIDVDYESDDYAWVQNKRAAVMMSVAGFGAGTSFDQATNKLYPLEFPFMVENKYVFIKVPQACQNINDVKKYLEGMTQLAFKIWVNMPKGAEYIPCYANFKDQAGIDFGVDANHADIIWVKMQPLGGKSPLSMTTLEYLRQRLPGQAFKAYDVAGEPPLRQMGVMLMGMVQNLRDMFNDPVNAFRKDAKAQTTDLTKCFVRLNAPKGCKYGGGYRVKSVTLRDNWNAMTGQYTAAYGQQYKYETTETVNGTTNTISSGVASYEPSIGGEENPWQSIVNIEDDLPLGPTSYGAVEMPVLDAFFPAPVVGYSKVTVTSIHAGTSAPKKSRSGIGRQVTEFYTAKDYPVSYSYTPFDENGVKEFHQNSRTFLFSQYSYDYKAQSQGFLVATNDMHGKLRSQTSYAEGEPETRVSYMENFYRNTGVNGLNEKFTFVDSYNNNVFFGNMGVDIELMTDAREFKVKGTSRDHQGNVDIFYILGVPVPVPTYWQINGTNENIYRAVTATKVISYRAVLDRVVVIEKGSKVETQNMAYDAETGQVLVTSTNNEFDRPVYNTKYPAYWAYSGMGPANKNIDATYTNVDFVDGKVINNSGIPFESGDELYIINPGNTVSCPTASDVDIKLIWAVDKNKNNSGITSVTPDFVFMDRHGLLYSRSGVTFRIIRSGRRNMLDQLIATVNSMDNPLTTGVLSWTNATKVINASAVEYRERWQTDNDLFKLYRKELDPAACTTRIIEDVNGLPEQSVNPYLKGLLGNFHNWRTVVFYDDRKEENFNNLKTNIAEYGFLKDFKPYWIKQPGYMLPDVQNKQWVWNSKLNRINAKGLELETMDPLGIYTSAQYGYHKSIPVAITNNALYDEMFAEGFEDYTYEESLGKIQYNSQAKRHVYFNKITDSFLVNTDTRDFKAHSGKYVLSVNGGSTFKAAFDVRSASALDYSLAFGSASSKSLQNPGLKLDYFNKEDPNSWNITNHPATTRTVDILDMWAASAQPANGYLASVGQTQYFEVATSGYYNLYLKAATSNLMFIVSTSMFISNMDGTFSMGYGTTAPGNAGSANNPTAGYEALYNNNIFLCKGVYMLQVNYSVGDPSVSANNPGNPHLTFEYRLNLGVNSNPFNGYQNYDNNNQCVFTLPAPANPQMVNPVFSAPVGKKMLLSAWVRESCGNAANGIPCKEHTYTHNQVLVKFRNNQALDVTMNPAGPIIDGWQRIEGVFTTPGGNDNMELSLVNSSAGPAYYDDIRIHPYNANMKSYVYDPVNLRLTAELDANNYATFYEYDEEGTLIRKKIETREGIKTVTESRSALQKIVQ